LHFLRTHWVITAGVFLMMELAMFSTAPAQDKLLISYGGHNETVGPMWVAVDRGIFKRYSLDVNMLQVRNGQVSLTAVMAGDVQAFWPAVSSVISGVSGGAKLGCVASPFNKIARELIVRKEIASLAALREKIFGVQSIGGGFWLQTMIVLDGLGVDAEKYKLQLRVIGDEPHGPEDRTRWYTRRVVDPTVMIEALEQRQWLPAIYFIFSRAGCERALEDVLGEGRPLITREQRREVDEAIAQALADQPALGESTLSQSVFRGLRIGVALHHAGILPGLKRLIESLFERDVTVGGPGLAASAFEAGLVDELFLSISPLLVGGGEPSVVEGTSLARPLPGKLLSVLESESFLYLRYSLRGT